MTENRPAGMQHPGVEPRAIFISYAGQDSSVANAVVLALEREGITCWIAPRDVTPGALYADAIIRAINEAAVLLLVLSTNSIASKHVGKEVERASSKGRAIVTLRLDVAPLTTTLEYFLSESQWIDWRLQGNAAALDQTIEAVRRHLAARADFAVDPALPQANSWVNRARRPSSRVLVSIVAVFVGVLAWLAIAQLPRHQVPAAPTTLGVSGKPASAGSPDISEKSVAVLPFVDMSEKRDQEYFSDGLSEELIDLLSKLPELRVPARTSSFYFKGKQVSILDIAKALHVSHVLEGSVRKSGKTLRITAQLIRVDTGFHVWSETYDRPVDDIFKVQDEIADAVVKALQGNLIGGEMRRSAPTSNSEAYTLFLQARSLWFKGGQQADDQRAINYLRRAVHLDSTFARAWATLGIYLVNDAAFFGTGFDQSMVDEAKSAAAQALRLDASLSDAHLASAVVRFFVDWDWTEADTELKRALKFDPGNSYAVYVQAGLLLTLGRIVDSVRLSERAVELDPLYAWNYASLGEAYRSAGRLDEAEAVDRKALELNDAGAGLHVTLANTLLAKGAAPAAFAEIQKERVTAIKQVALPRALDALGRVSEADEALRIAEAQNSTTQAFWIAAIYAGRNDLTRAFEWLDRAYHQRDPILASNLKTDPLLTNLRADPRYRTLIEKMNLPR